MRVEHARPLQVEVHVDLPREPHAAVHLHRGLAVHDRGFARERLRPGDPTIEITLPLPELLERSPEPEEAGPTLDDF